MESYTREPDREWRLYYWSEVDATFELYVLSENDVRLVARHTQDGVPISTWFHFSNIENSSEVIEFGGKRIKEVLCEAVDALYPGAAPVLEQDGSNIRYSPEETFAKHFFFAFCIGGWWSGVGNFPEDYVPNIKRRIGLDLLYPTERFK